MSRRPMTRADYEEMARERIQGQLLNHPDELVRAIALICDPPPEAVARVADALEGLANTPEDGGA